tara:strand:- start:356 stop:520 length:165 start_codon:yes stop_codon:yes gene_type:complete
MAAVDVQMQEGGGDACYEEKFGIEAMLEGHGSAVRCICFLSDGSIATGVFHTSS